MSDTFWAALGVGVPLFIWVAGLTWTFAWQMGRLSLRVEQHETRLNSGSLRMDEIERDQNATALHLAKIEGSLSRIEGQNRQIWSVIKVRG